MISDAEWNDRNNRRTQSLIKNARLHYKGSVESIIYEQAGNIDQLKILDGRRINALKKNKNI